jgi:hypothetical protein
MIGAGVAGWGGVPGYAPYGCVPVAPWPPPCVAVVPPGAWIGSAYDLDHRDIRYNRYFQRHQPPPRVRGYTLR